MRGTGRIRGLFAATGLVALTACAGDGYSAFHSEAGGLIDAGGFGNATMNNTLVLNGDRGHVAALNTRFEDQVQNMVTFAFNSAVLDATGQAVVAQQAAFIRQFPEVRFRVYGHTDLVGSSSYNKQLGLRRAQAVVGYLVSHGISASRLEALASFGETQPVVVTQGRERRNRRTVTEVTGFVSSHPMVLDGKYAAIVYRDYVRSAQSASTLTGADAASAGPVSE